MKFKFSKIFTLIGLIAFAGLSIADENGGSGVDGGSQSGGSQSGDQIWVSPLLKSRTTNPGVKAPSSINLTFKPSLSFGIPTQSGPTPLYEELLTKDYFSGIGSQTNYLQMLNQSYDPFSVKNMFLSDFACHAPKDPVLEVGAATDVEGCYSNRIRHNQPDKLPNGVVDNKYLLESDLQICNCLEAKAITMPELKTLLNSKSFGENSDNDALIKNFEANAKRVKEKLDEKTIGLSFDASILGEGSSRFTRLYATNPQAQLENAPKALRGASSASAGGGIAASMIGGMIGHYQDKMSITTDDLSKERGGGGLFATSAKKEERAAFKSKIEEALADVSIGSAPDERVLAGETQFAPGQCVGAREFLAFRQNPEEQILQELSDATSFKEEEWDHNFLKVEYDKLMKGNALQRMQNKSRIVQLKAKLIYLARNPLVKNLFAAKADYKDYLKVSTLNANKKRKLEQVTDAALLEKKRALFNKLKKLAPADKSCFSQGKGACQKQNIVKGKTEEVKNQLKDFFTNEFVSLVTTVENEKDMYRDIAGLFDKESFGTKPKALTQESLVADFVKSTGLTSPDSCVPNSTADSSERASQVVECAKVFGAYCQQTLQPARAQISKMGSVDPDIVDDLDVKTDNILNIDINKNPEFKAFNDEVCNTKRRKSKGDQTGDFPTFFDYATKYCSSRSASPECPMNEPKDYEVVRTKYLADYPESANPENATETSATIAAFNEKTKRDPTESINRRDAGSTLASNSLNEDTPDIGSIREGMGLSRTPENNSNDFIAEAPKKEQPLISSAKFIDDASKAMKSSEEARIDDSQMNYSNSMISNQIANQNSETKVENMTNEQRQELLEDWQKEYDSWKKNNNGSGNKAVASANEAAMKAKIDALEQLLEQQRALTQEQYKLLNEAIAGQTKAAQSQIAANANQEQQGQRIRSNNPVVSNETQIDDIGRGPASIGQNQFNTSGANSGSASGAGASVSGRNGSRSNAIADSTADSVAREEAKLVNLRRNNDGSITIESAGASGGSAAANAITVPVTDEQYRILQTNPTGLNLQQLQSSIPQDQIAKLEKNGEIIIILRNGSNPPFEVKLEKKDNKLVYRLKDNNGNAVNPVRRVFTRQALELQLKAQR